MDFELRVQTPTQLSANFSQKNQKSGDANYPEMFKIIMFMYFKIHIPHSTYIYCTCTLLMAVLTFGHGNFICTVLTLVAVMTLFAVPT